MKIAYFICWVDGIESGVFKKLTRQIDFWKKDGNEVKLFVFTTKNSKLEKDVSSKNATFSFTIELISFKSKISQITNSYKIYKAIKLFKPDLVYMRECLLYYPGVLKVNKNFTSIIELNSITKNEMNKKSVRYWYNTFTQFYKFKYINAFIAVTDEIANHKSFSNYTSDKYVIGNGIDVNSNEILNLTENKKNIVFIGSIGQKWHGIDKIIELAKVKTNWIFHIIGIENNLNIKNDNIIFYGNLDKLEYEKIYHKSDVALGTLALHRKQMQEACPLKTREYLSYGLPIIIGYKDVDFIGEYSFICQLENEESNVINNIKKIEDFVNLWKGKRIDYKDIKHLDTSIKERIRLDIFKKHVK